MHIEHELFVWVELKKDKMILVVGFEPTAIGSRIRRSVQTELHEQGTLLVGIEPTTNG